MLRRFSIGHRLQVCFVCLLFILLGVAAAGLLAVRNMADNLRVVYEERAVPVELMFRLNDLLQRNRVLVMDMLINPSTSNVNTLLAEFKQNTAEAEQALARYREMARTPDVERLFADFDTARQRYLQEGVLKAREAMEKGDFDEVQFVYLNQITPLAAPLKTALLALTQRQVAQAGEDYAAAKAQSEAVTWLVLGLLGAGVLLGAGLAWGVTRSITHPMAWVDTLANRVGEGDLTGFPAQGGKDEMARLSQCLDRMRHRLAEIVVQVREGSLQIAHGSGEISHGVGDLSRRTEQQAASLQQANASLEGLLQGTHQHAQVAQQARSLTRQASDHALESGEAVGRLVAQIGTVHERSQRITDITSVIDGIAFQTNILALNAAVEAARAGEQGRGFAVVAQEVRTLAQRSAAAAAEIKQLVTDAVTSVERVTAMADGAGQTVQAIVAHVATVDQLMSHLSEASARQSQELTHISQAMALIDQMTQQNAALVEENAAATLSLKKEATELDALVASFRLDGPAGTGDHLRMSPTQTYLIST